MSNLNGLILSVVNMGDKRASYCIQIDGHLSAETALPVVVSRRSIEALNDMISMGKQFNSPMDKLQKAISERLRGFPGGDEVYTHLENNGVEVFDYIDESIKLFEGLKTVNSPDRAARGQGHVTKAKKLLTNALAKLSCTLAEPSKDGKISKEMFEAGLTAALELIPTIGKEDVFERAMKIAEKAGLDENGRVRLRASSGSDDSEESAE